jgi:hypothetical protein
MKLVRLGAVSLFALGLLALPLTQGTALAKGASKSAKTPEEMSKEALAKWKTTLKITDEQAPQFEQVMTESYTKMAEAKTAAAGDKAKMKESMATIMQDRNDALAKVLTPDQMKIYNEKANKMASHAKKKMAKAEGAAK